jgi:hypothetical protein
VGWRWPKLALLEDLPILNVVYLFWMLTIGFPLYLLVNAGGQPGGFNSHFDPSSPKLFAPHQRPSVWLGIAGIATVVLAALSKPSCCVLFFSVTQLPLWCGVQCGC